MNEEIMKMIAELAEKTADSLAALTEIQHMNNDKMENVVSELSHQCTEIEELQVQLQKDKTDAILLGLKELQQVVADLKEEPVGMLFTKVV